MDKRSMVRALGVLGILAAYSLARGDDGAFPALGGRPLIPARYTSGCGTDALYLCLELNGAQVSYADFVRRSGLTSARDAIDMARLWQLARDCGAHAQAIRVRNGTVALRKVMADLSIRTAVVHLKAVERNGRRDEEHFSAVLRTGDTLRIVGEETYEREVAPEWESRWSGAVLLVSARPIVLSGPLSGAQAQLVISPSRFDCGRVFVGSTTAYEFTVENRGDADLEISDVKSDCSCAAPTVGATLIPPKQSASLKGLVDAGPSTGRRSVQITVFGNDPERPQVTVNVVLDVVPLPVRLSSSNVVMTGRRRDERAEFVLGVEYPDPAATIRVARVESSADWLTAELTRDGRQVKLAADPLKHTTLRSATLTLYTAEPEAALRVPVEVRWIEPLECQPAQLYLDRRREPGVVNRTITVRPQPDIEAARVTAEIRGVPGAVKSVRQVADAGYWQVDLEFGPWPAETTMLVGAVVISAAPNSEVNSVELPVYVR